VWLALQLHKRNKARILLPEWLSSKQLSGGVVTLNAVVEPGARQLVCPAAATGVQTYLLALNWMVPAQHCLSARGQPWN
jgi:hypothetical protein